MRLAVSPLPIEPESVLPLKDPVAIELALEEVPFILLTKLSYLRNSCRH